MHTSRFSQRLRRLPPLAALLALAFGAAGCASLNPGSEDAAAAASGFLAAVQAGDGAAACAFLAPVAVEEIEGDEPSSCSGKILQLHLPAAGKVTGSQAYGRNAQVVLDTDTMFLTRSGDRWKVLGAGCTFRGERPYDCEVDGS
ncbi:hypothetical protein ACWF5H_01055 [Arthrobacter sp. NPDC055138]